MALVCLTAPPSTLLSTLSKVSAELGVSDPDSLAVLGDMLRRASEAITDYCGRPFFGVGQYQETLKGTGSQLLGLTCVPVLSVTQVLRDQEVLPPWTALGTLDDAYLIEDAEAGALYNPAGWGQTVAALSWGWESYSSRYILPGGTSTLRYTVTYTAGWLLPNDPGFPSYNPTTGVVLDPTSPPVLPNVPAVENTPATPRAPQPLPGGIEQAALVTVKTWWFSRQRDMTVTQQRSDEQSVTYAASLQDKALPTVALGLLRDYRRVA